jgi:hypothetical protein
MHWINKVWLLAGAFALAAMMIVSLFGAGWYALIAGLPAFIGASVVVPFFLDVSDPRIAIRKPRRRRRHKRTPRRQAPKLALAAAPTARDVSESEREVRIAILPIASA